MKTNIIIIIFFISHLNLFGCCESDDRTLTQFLFENKNLTIFKCKIISTSVDTNQNVFSIALITEIYFGNIDSAYVTLNTGNLYSSVGASKYKENSIILVYTSGKGSIFNCGGNCDIRTKIFFDSPEQRNETKILKQFASIYKNKKSGKFTFLSSNNNKLAVGEFHKGNPVNIWKHYYNNGILKHYQDLKTKHSKMYNANGFILSDNIQYKDSSVSLAYSNSTKNQLTYRWVTIPNNKGFVTIMYEYYSNGCLKLLEGYTYINVNGGTSTDGKIGKYFEGFENGNPKVIGEFSKSKRIGIWKWYDEFGNFIAEYDYKDGTTPQ